MSGQVKSKEEIENYKRQKKRENYKRWYETKGREKLREKYVRSRPKENLKARIEFLEHLGYTVIPPQKISV